MSEKQEQQEELQQEELNEEQAEAIKDESLEAELEALRAQVKEYEDRYLRVHADFENTKKRLEREKNQLLEYAYEKFAKDLLPAFDSLEMALSSANNAEADKEELLEKLKEGIALTIDQFTKIFLKHGVELIDTNEGFNPHLHEAIMQVPSEHHDEGDVVLTLQKGYKYKERVLRPAMVSICKK